MTKKPNDVGSGFSGAAKGDTTTDEPLVSAEPRFFDEDGELSICYGENESPYSFAVEFRGDCYAVKVADERSGQDVPVQFSCTFQRSDGITRYDNVADAAIMFFFLQNTSMNLEKRHELAGALTRVKQAAVSLGANEHEYWPHANDEVGTQVGYDCE